MQYLQNGNVTLAQRRTGNYKMELKGIKEMEPIFHLSKKEAPLQFCKTLFIKTTNVLIINSSKATQTKQNCVLFEVFRLGNCGFHSISHFMYMNKWISECPCIFIGRVEI